MKPAVRFLRGRSDPLRSSCSLWHIALGNVGGVGLAAGLYFLLRWYRGKKRHEIAIAEIRGRAPQVEIYSRDDE